MTLDQIRPGHSALVQYIESDEKTRTHLERYGLHRGSTLKLISVLGENYIVSIKDSRFALDRRTAREIHLGEPC